MKYLVYRDDQGRYHYISADMVDSIEEVVHIHSDEQAACDDVRTLNHESVLVEI